MAKFHSFWVNISFPLAHVFSSLLIGTWHNSANKLDMVEGPIYRVIKSYMAC